MNAAPLTGGEVQVWHYQLETDVKRQHQLKGLLDEQERDRANRFRFEEHRRRFIVRRGVLRLILASYTGVKPEEIRYAHDDGGKPRIDSSLAAGRPFRFSASSSQALGAVAVACDRDVGLDIEQVRPDRDHELIAREFSDHEAAELSRLESAKRAAAFFDLWTCKEAYLKGKGLGLSAPLDRFSIAIGSEPPRLTWSALDAADPGLWSLHRLNVDPGFAACLAVAGGCRNIVCDRYVW